MSNLRGNHRCTQCSTHCITPYSPDRHFLLRYISAGGFGGHKSVRQPITPSVKRVLWRMLWRNERNLCNASVTTYEREMHLVLRHEEWLVGDVPFYVIFWTKLTHHLRRWCKTPSVKVKLTLIGSVLCAFKWALNIQRTLPVSISRRLKTQNGRCSYKSILIEESLLQSFFQRQSCKTFAGLSNRAKMVTGDAPFYRKFWLKLTHSLKNVEFQSIFARSASAVTHSDKVN